jgi:hypothetical protein
MNKGQTETADLEQGKIVWAAQKQLFIDRGDADILKKTEWMVQTMGADMTFHLCEFHKRGIPLKVCDLLKLGLRWLEHDYKTKANSQ